MGKVKGNFRYVTNRTLLNKAGEEKGMIAVLVPKEGDVAKVRYRCPECQHTEQTEEAWKKPFSVKCGGCGKSMKLPKLMAQHKREKKKELEKER